MRLPKKAIAQLGDRILRDLKEQGHIAIEHEEEVAGRLAATLESNLEAEEKLVEDARALLKTHAAAMGRGDIEYQEMLRLVKQKLAKERKFVL